MTLIRKHINILLPLLVVSAICRVIPGVEFLYYLTPILLVFFIISGYDQILKNKQLRIFIILLGSFGLWAGLTSLWSDYPFVSLSRALYFLLIAFGAAFGIVLWSKESNSRKNIFGFLLPANILIVASSLVSLLIGYPTDAWSAGNGMGFMGFAAHQNTLGALILFTFPALLYPTLNEVQHLRNWKNNALKVAPFLTYILLLTSSIWLLVLSNSRASILALSVGIFLTFFFYFNGKQKIYFVGLLTLVAIIIAFTPSLSTKIEKFALKGTSHITANRDILWEPSCEAAKLGGLFGIGYGISHPDIILDGTGSHYESGRYIREKGNSILALIEEVGLVGLLLFILPIIYAIAKAYPKWQSMNLMLTVNCSLPARPSAWLIALILHSQFEAWMVSMGSFSLLIFLMFLSFNLWVTNESL